MLGKGGSMSASLRKRPNYCVARPDAKCQQPALNERGLQL